MLILNKEVRINGDRIKCDVVFAGEGNLRIQSVYKYEPVTDPELIERVKSEILAGMGRYKK